MRPAAEMRAQVRFMGWLVVALNLSLLALSGVQGVWYLAPANMAGAALGALFAVRRPKHRVSRTRIALRWTR